VGVTVGKMLAFSTGKPVCGVSTLESLAYEARNESELICAIISAGIKDAVYAGFYRITNGMLIQEDDYFTGDIKGLAALLKEPVVLIGDGAAEYARAFPQKMIVKTVQATPGGAAIALLAARKFEKGKSDEALSLTPLYLKESTAKAFTNKYTGAK
jgi:tRNA threonylcarbamoyladenosine biosynthesis protein TsaB